MSDASMMKSPAWNQKQTLGIGIGSINSNGVAAIPYMFYQLIMGDEYAKERALNWAPADVMERAIGFVQDPQLKQAMYTALRRRALDNKMSNSVIINEMTGIYRFFKRFVEYGIITVKMYLDK